MQYSNYPWHAVLLSPVLHKDAHINVTLLMKIKLQLQFYFICVPERKYNTV